MERSKKEHNKKRRASSRLQKHAPPALHVDRAKSDKDGIGQYAIPFLSPLMLSPAVLDDVVVMDSIAKQLAPGKSKGPCGDDGVKLSATKGWKHPAIGVAVESSNLGAMFQAQCMLVNKF